MLHNNTCRNGARHTETDRDIVLEIDGDIYLSTTEVVERLGISRQTLWRWRQEEKIPPGHRYRGRLVLFSAAEVGAIESFANRLEPIHANGDVRQLGLFGNGGG